ncbi:uncharacterized protein LOC62_03G004159 [Vanrija pseudolonga]|uniref:Uncharacterized protein n=1 Tax=Vanrija pseudolonga TaxID=143232 RepID=A0AAF0YAG8_9TREE|nr:hypothetical protein LOC62_03G004159 [Vanrija pseudolonga]
MGLGGVRAIRDYVDGTDTLSSAFAPFYVPGKNGFWYGRQWYDNRTTQWLHFEAAHNAVFKVAQAAEDTLPSIRVARWNKWGPARIRFTATFNSSSPQMVGLSPAEVLAQPSSSDSPVRRRVLEAIRDNATAITAQLSFLTYDSVSLGGGWRYLTYMGRDTLIALKLLMPVLSPHAIEIILTAVIERFQADGDDRSMVCHEELVGDYASYKLQNNSQSRCNYDVSDTHFLLLPVLADYFDTAGTARAAAFLARNHSSGAGTYSDIVTKHASMVMRHVFNYHIKTQAHNMNGYFDGGNWRDSPAGNGHARWFFDVNAGMIPASVRAIQCLINDGLIGTGNGTIYALSRADSIASKYESYCPETFQAVSLTEGECECEALLKDYIDELGLSTSLLYGAGSLNATGTPGAGWNDPDQVVTEGYSRGFYSLVSEHDRKGHILHSDIAFPLLYSTHVPAELIRGTARALQPYPRGLLTNVGMVVANAAYDGNKTKRAEFTNRAPHGAVVWGFQQALMAAGVARQLAACAPSNNRTPLRRAAPWAPWCRDKKLVAALEQAQTRLWDSIAGSAPVLYNEMWVPVWNATEGKFTIGDLATLNPSAPEGNAFRLWSYGMLGLVDPRTGRPVAEGFGHSDTR